MKNELRYAFEMKKDLSARNQRLRDKMLVSPAVCVERAVYYTESWKQTEGLPTPVRRGKALRHILENITVAIDSDELIVGRHTSKIRGGALLPELSAGWILEEMNHLETRTCDPYAPMSDEEKRQITEVVQYWKGRSLRDQLIKNVPPELNDYNHTAVSGMGFAENGHYPAHVAIDYELLLAEGLDGVEKKIRAEKAVAPTKSHKADVLDGMVEAFYGVRAFAMRYSNEAQRLAMVQSDPQRKIELLEIASLCSRVPMQPADSLRSALQSCWFMYVCLLLEGWGAGMSLGRMDQYLNAFYCKDRASGTLDEYGASELVGQILIKMNGVINPQDKIVATMMSGSPIMQGITIGGCDKDGEDAVNEMSFIILAAEHGVGLTTEDIVVRINHKNPIEYILKSCEVARDLGGKLKFVSDRQTLAAMAYQKIPVEDARNYISTGCHNPTIPAVTHDIGGSSFNYPLILELTLNRGICRASGKMLGVDVGDPRCMSFDELLDALEKEFEFVMERLFLFKNADLALYEKMPCPLLSAFYRGCIEKGEDIYDYGVPTTHTSAFCGAPDVGDSLAAIKKTIYDDKSLTWDRLLRLLDSDMQGDNEAVALLRRAPKFGNNDPYVDELLRDVLARACDWLHSHTAYGGVKTTAACLTMTINIPFGHVVGALPDGRRSGEPLSEGGISPHQGRNTMGVTSTLASVAALDQTKLSHGSILNIRISKSAVAAEDKLKKLAEALLVFCETGGDLVQFNFIDTRTLRDAQLHPENHRDLLVRVATYSAYFVELSRELQDDIIARFEFQTV